MKQVSVSFAATFVVISMLKSANAGPLENCFGTNFAALDTDRVYVCLDRQLAQDLFNTMSPWVKKIDNANVNNRSYGAFTALTWDRNDLRVDCYKQSFWDPKKNEKLPEAYSCLLYKKRPTVGNNIPFPSWR
jgi:hypothetical protein